MKVKVLFFASFREVVGHSSQTFELSEGETTSDLFAHISQIYPSLLLESISVVVNKKYISDPVILMDGDEVAFCPPISGG